MKKISLVLLYISLSILSKAQSLREIELLALNGYYIDSAEIKLNGWDFKLEKVKNETIDSINYDIYAFRRRSEDYYKDGMVMLYKNKKDVMRSGFFDIRIVTYSDKRFIELKSECTNQKDVILYKEGIVDDKLIRKYKNDWFDYNFSEKNGSETKNKTYYVDIKVNMANIIH